jgi:hypothetical protein
VHSVRYNVVNFILVGFSLLPIGQGKTRHTETSDECVSYRQGRQEYVVIHPWSSRERRKGWRRGTRCHRRCRRRCGGRGGQRTGWWRARRCRRRNLFWSHQHHTTAIKITNIDFSCFINKDTRWNCQLSCCR